VSNLHDGAIAFEHKCKHILYATILEKEKVRLFGIIEDIKKVGHVRKVENDMEIQDFLVREKYEKNEHKVVCERLQKSQSIFRRWVLKQIVAKFGFKVLSTKPSSYQMVHV
jgi:excinuclease UvrABC ATPase subunit